MGKERQNINITKPQSYYFEAHALILMYKDKYACYNYCSRLVGMFLHRYKYKDAINQDNENDIKQELRLTTWISINSYENNRASSLHNWLLLNMAWTMSTIMKKNKHILNERQIIELDNNRWFNPEIIEEQIDEAYCKRCKSIKSLKEFQGQHRVCKLCQKVTRALPSHSKSPSKK